MSNQSQGKPHKHTVLCAFMHFLDSISNTVLGAAPSVTLLFPGKETWAQRSSHLPQVTLLGSVSWASRHPNPYPSSSATHLPTHTHPPLFLGKAGTSHRTKPVFPMSWESVYGLQAEEICKSSPGAVRRPLHRIETPASVSGDTRGQHEGSWPVGVAGPCPQPLGLQRYRGSLMCCCLSGSLTLISSPYHPTLHTKAHESPYCLSR